MNTVEVAVEQRLVGLYSATKTLRDLSRDTEGRTVIGRPKCLEEIELVRDVLSRIIDEVGGKHG
ncbi:hypothetical protein CWO90_35265 [Bradyrhizobium sp. Leo121]|nr:hypothetical protein CWO90_35265 [Bradyrhizobium sp. Leo121]